MPNLKLSLLIVSVLFSEEDPEVKAIKAKQERYVRQMLALKRIIDQWHSKKVSKHEAIGWSREAEFGEIHIKEPHVLESPWNYLSLQIQLKVKCNFPIPESYALLCIYCTLILQYSIEIYILSMIHMPICFRCRLSCTPTTSWKTFAP